MSISPNKRGMSPPKEVRFDATSEKTGKDKLAKLSKKFGADRPNTGEYKLSLRRVNSATKELTEMDEDTRVEHILNLMEKPKQLQRSMSLSRRSFMDTGDYATDLFTFQTDLSLKRESELNVLER